MADRFDAIVTFGAVSSWFKNLRSAAELTRGFLDQQIGKVPGLSNGLVAPSESAAILLADDPEWRTKISAHGVGLPWYGPSHYVHSRAMIRSEKPIARLPSGVNVHKEGEGWRVRLGKKFTGGAVGPVGTAPWFSPRPGS